MAAPTRTEHTRKLLAQTAARIIESGGLRALTMISAASESGLARATVYNYVRDKDQLAKLAYREFFAEISEFGDTTDVARGLYDLATFVAQHPLIVGLRTFNPSVLQSGIDYVVQAPSEVADVVADRLHGWNINADRTAGDTVLRWLASYCISPGSDAGREAGAEVLAASLRIDARL